MAAPAASGSHGARVATSAKQWLAEGQEHFVAYRPESEVPLEDVRTAVDAANAQSRTDPEGGAAVGDVVVAVGRERHIRCSWMGSKPVRMEWLANLASHLPDGEIVRPKRINGPPDVTEEIITARVLKGFFGLRSGLDPALLIEPLRAAYSLPDATAYVAADQAGFPHADDDTLTEPLRVLCKRVVRVLFAGPEGEWTEIHCSGSGRASGFRRSASAPWEARLKEARDALGSMAALLDYGFARETPALVDWLSLAGTPPTPVSGEQSRDFYWDHRLWHGRVADAHGLQLLTSEHLERAHDLSDWEVTPVSDDRYLVETRHPEAWFDRDTPDPERLERARHDFGNIVITQEELEAHRAARRRPPC